MRRAPPPLSDADSLIVSQSASPAPPPPPSSGDPHQNPWRITSPAAVAASAAATVSLMGEPSSSWPPLNFQHLSDSPPPETHPPAVIGADKPTIGDLPSLLSPPSSSPSSSTSSAEIAPHENSVASSKNPPAISTTPDTISTSPVPAFAPHPSSGNADSPRHPSRPHASAYRRGRNPRPHHHRGGGGGGRYNNNGHVNRPPAPAWRPNWNFDSQPQFPNWGFFPGSAMPPADVNGFFVPYPQPYNGLMYPDYGGGAEPYGVYYDHPTYEMPFAPPLTPMGAGVPPHQVAPSFSGSAAHDHQVDMVKDQLLFQIEYYFSDENLVKDTYLKRQMDSEGWVDIHEIAGFRKVAGLTEDINLIKEALQSSNVVELQGNKIRKRHGWDKWILQQSSSSQISLAATGMRSIRLGD